MGHVNGGRVMVPELLIIEEKQKAKKINKRDTREGQVNLDVNKKI